jgi:hypothetical protein
MDADSNRGAPCGLLSMSGTLWTWDAREHADVAVALAAPASDLDWCERLETAPKDGVVGKVLCVCAASSIARLVLFGQSGGVSEALDALELLDCWIDDPTPERFDRICALIFEEGLPESAMNRLAWWALRTATSCVDCWEAGWAFQALCDTALESGFSAEQLRATAERAVAARARPVYRGSDGLA